LKQPAASNGRFFCIFSNRQLSVVSSPWFVILPSLGISEEMLSEEAKVERTNFEKLRVYRLSEKLADELWRIVMQWNYFARDTVGKQLVRGGQHWCKYR
jgi:hypothetical protein